MTVGMLHIEKMKMLSLTRPYSIPNVIFVALIAVALGASGLNFNETFLVSIIFSISFWIACVFFLDFQHKHDDGREEFLSKANFIIPSAIVIIVGLANNFYIILFFLASLATVKLYSLKSKKIWLSKISFLFRPFTEIGIIYSVALIHNYPLDNQLLFYFSIMVYALTISKNIIADIRDEKYDKHTIAKKIGKTGIYSLSLLFLLIGIIMSFPKHEVIPLVVTAMLIIFGLNAYALHRTYTLTLSFFYALMLIQLTNDYFLVIMLLFLSTMLNYTYGITPRKSNIEKPSWA